MGENSIKISMRRLFCAFCLLLRIAFLNATDVPIIGILTLEPNGIKRFYPNMEIGSYIAASYVKFLESAGARVIPVWIGQNQQYYERVVKYTNGILFPGGATFFNESNGYAEAAKMLFDIVQKLNDSGVYFPLIGICLGMQVLAFASTGGKDIRVDCNAMKISLPLEFNQNYKESRIFQNIPDDILSYMKDENVTYNYHKFCLTDKELTENNLNDVWRVVTENVDSDGKKFISTMEHRRHPFYAFQFHPEKIRYEFQLKLQIPHDVHSGKVSQYLADFIVQEGRKNNNSFPDKVMEHESLIYNFNPVLGAINCSYFQLYLFTKNEPTNYQLIKMKK